MIEKILITGSEGFIGKALAQRLREDGNRVIPFSRSIGHDLNEPNPFQLFLKEEFTTVFHLAAVSFVPQSWEDPTSFYQVNTLGTQKVLEFCRKKGSRLIYVSSYVYGPPHYLPVDESHPVTPNNPYAHSKWLGEELCRFYASHFNLKVHLIRPFNIYGPGQSDRYVIPKILRQWSRGEIVVEDLSPKRDFLYIDDFVDACLVTLKENLPWDVSNVGSGLSVSVSQLIDIIEEIDGKRVTRRSLEQHRRDAIPDVVSKSRLIESDLWKPKISLREGLSRIIQSFR